MKYSDPEKIKRLAIFFFYDKDGVVDDYLSYLLADLKQNVAELLIVCNGKLTVEGRRKFTQLTPHLLVRENSGFDVWAYKTGLEYYGWDKLSGYDEVALLNFTIMGPLYPFKVMFDEMSARDVDFWGITRHYGIDYDPYQKCKYGYIPMHIQSSFMVMRSSLVQSIEFQRYWEQMPAIHDYAEAICWHEAIFTEEFTQKGFASDTYVDSEDLKEYSNYPLMLYPTELIAHRHCPIFKRKTFYNQYEEFLDVSCGQPGYELYQYLAEHTAYPLDFIWDTLLRTANLADLKERMQLNYVLPTRVCLPRRGPAPRVALFLHIYYMDLVEYCKGYAAAMPEYADIYLTTNTEEKKAVVEQAFADFGGRKVTVLVVPNRGRDVSALVIGLKSYARLYDYVCFAHDKKSNQIKPKMIGESFSYQCFENVLANPVYVENILTTFEENPRLGLLVPPPPIHSDFNTV
jgi:lipopolysaccharide biosynthesis protein